MSSAIKMHIRKRREKKREKNKKLTRNVDKGSILAHALHKKTPLSLLKGGS